LFGQSSELDRLLEGNKRFMNGDLLHPNRTEERRKGTVGGQEPFAVVVSCSDSRVSPEIVFDEGIGDLFVVRLAGNVIGPIAKESIEFSVHALHSSIILVLGHENCGAVNAVLQKQDQDIPEIAALIAPSLQKIKSKGDLQDAIKANALNMKDKLAQDPDFKKLIDEKKLQVYAGYYHLKSGEVEILK
jgi:carbonic anhydrase